MHTTQDHVSNPVVAAIALLLVGAACTDDLTFPDGPIRLAELLHAAEIDSPLVDIRFPRRPRLHPPR